MKINNRTITNKYRSFLLQTLVSMLKVEILKHFMLPLLISSYKSPINLKVPTYAAVELKISNKNNWNWFLDEN